MSDTMKRGLFAALLVSLMLLGGTQRVGADPLGRYFPQTGFSIDNATIDDYVTHRGDVATFGYPVSRTFLFEGLTTQFFQRRIVQLDPTGLPRLVNILDPGLMPYTRFNGATFPSIDGQLQGAAPTPADQIATLAFVKDYAPDLYEGTAVNFYQTFIGTVSAAVAFPNGGDASLLPGFDLEMWGVPTSLPTVDPNNHQVIYLRFQRGVMMYDGACGCTQGVLLADYLKSILLGQNLPSDLLADAQGSPLLGQFPPSSGVFTPPGSVPIVAPTPTAIPTPVAACSLSPNTSFALTWHSVHEFSIVLSPGQSVSFIILKNNPGAASVRYWVANSAGTTVIPGRTFYLDQAGLLLPLSGFATPDTYTVYFQSVAIGDASLTMSYETCPAGAGP